MAATPRLGALIKLAGVIGSRPAVILVDSGATGNFVSTKFAADAKLVLTAGPHSVASLANGQPQDASGIACGTSLRIDTYVDRIDFNVTDLGHYDVILGMAWLEQYQVVPDWRNKSVSFVDSEGKQHRLRGATTGCARWNPSAIGAIVGPSLNVVSLRQVERLHRNGQLDLACVVFPNSCHPVAGAVWSSTTVRPCSPLHGDLCTCRTRPFVLEIVSQPSSGGTKDRTPASMGCQRSPGVGCGSVCSRPVRRSSIEVGSRGNIGSLRRCVSCQLAGRVASIAGGGPPDRT